MFVLAKETLLHNLNQRNHVETLANVNEIKHLGIRYNYTVKIHIVYTELFCLLAKRRGGGLERNGK